MAASMVAFWGAGGARALFAISPRWTGRWSRPVAEQALAERFARGDIDEPEYRQRLDVLRGGVSIEALPRAPPSR